MKGGRILRRVLAVLVLFITLLFLPTPSYAKVYWEGTELVAGQIGKIKILQPINLWKKENNKLTFVRILSPGETYRVYGYDEKEKQYRVGGSFLVTNIKGRIAYSTPTKEKLSQLSLGNENDAIIKQLVQYPKGYESNADVKAIMKRLSSIPITTLQKLKQSGVTIKLVDQPITSVPEYTYLKGEVPRGWEGTNKTWDDVPGIGGTAVVVVRIGYSEYGKGHGSMNLELHETAHTIDSFVYQELSSTSSFRKIWNKETVALFGDNEYYTNYVEEYFAETFAMYYYSSATREILKNKAPQTYTFFQNLQ